MNSIAIEVAIGVVLMYLLLSLMCTVINEAIAGALKARANMLSQAISDLINDASLYENFYRHGLIQSVIVATKGNPAYLSSKTVAGALLDSLSPGTPIPGVADLQNTVASLPNSNIKDVIQSAINTANGNMEKVRDGIAAWFDDAMDRVGGLYKRKAQLWALLVGLGIAFVLNADTIAVANLLWGDGSLRAQVNSVADQAARKFDTRIFDSADAQATALKDAAARSMEIQDALRPFPIGWNSTSMHFAWDRKLNWYQQSWRNVGWDGVAILIKILGLFITGLALSLGAPFWFDILGKLINIRATGAKPDANNK